MADLNAFKVGSAMKMIAELLEAWVNVKGTFPSEL